MTRPLYFLPGLMCNQLLWKNLWPHLSSHLDPIHLTFGLHHTMAPMLTDITQAIDLEPVDLVGFSMGGYLALRYALTYPHAVKRCVIIAATGKHLTTKEQTTREHILNHVKSNLYKGMSKQRLSQFVHPDHLNSPIADTIRAMDHALGKETLVAQLAATSQRASLLEQLPSLDFPVLVIGGQQDKLVKPDEVYQLASHFRHAEVAIIDHCGHMCPLEAPLTLAQKINTFLAATK